jgi:polyisoprenoid-binding protein YceI
MKARHSVFVAFAAIALIAGASQAQAPAGAPPAAAAPKDNPANAPAGVYNVDTGHTSVVARVSHQGTSWSTVRFMNVTGALTWDPANAAANKLTATVETASLVVAPAKHPDGSTFQDRVKGDGFLKTVQFPNATFTSTKFTKVDAKHAKVEGNLTLMGVTKPLTFDVTLVGATATVVGVEATASINGKDYGLPAFIAGTPIGLQVDIEFKK